jgi:hypothetical protein
LSFWIFEKNGVSVFPVLVRRVPVSADAEDQEDTKIRMRKINEERNRMFREFSF